MTSYAYSPFGEGTVSGGLDDNDRLFTGRELDETGLYYYRARYYSPGMQRFISPDPLGFAGGDTNLYGYSGNSPLNFSDPSGLCFGLGHCPIIDDVGDAIGDAVQAVVHVLVKIGSQVVDLAQYAYDDFKDALVALYNSIGCAHEDSVAGRKDASESQCSLLEKVRHLFTEVYDAYSFAKAIEGCLEGVKKVGEASEVAPELIPEIGPEAAIGGCLAGVAKDEMIARIIDALLRKAGVLDPEEHSMPVTKL